VLLSGRAVCTDPAVRRVPCQQNDRDGPVSTYRPPRPPSVDYWDYTIVTNRINRSRIFKHNVFIYDLYSLNLIHRSITKHQVKNPRERESFRAGEGLPAVADDDLVVGSRAVVTEQRSRSLPKGPVE
jgi:hypothetical protein